MTPATVALLQPVEEGLVSLAAVAITAAAGLLTAWAQRHFAIANTAAAKSMEADANAVVQSAMENGAGDVVARIKTGAIDLTDAKGIRAAAVSAAMTAADKVPAAVALLAPGIGLLADMVEQKTHLALAPAIVAAAVAKSAAGPGAAPVVTTVGTRPA